VKEFLTYQKTGKMTDSLVDKFKTAFSQIAKQKPIYRSFPTGPFVNIGGGGSQDITTSVDLDPRALTSGNFQDVVKVQNTRVAAFPDFLMDWVTRQLEEVVTKLTNLPKVFLILPDFSGILDYGWGNFGQNISNTFQQQANQNAQKNANFSSQIESLQNQKTTLDCGGKDLAKCTQLDFQVQMLRQRKNVSNPSALSGIRAAYEFL